MRNGGKEKRKKRCDLGLAVLLLGGLLVGCTPKEELAAGEAQRSAQSEEETAESGSEAFAENDVSGENSAAGQPGEEADGYVTEEEMAQADLWPSCDDTALKKLMCRAEQGEAITIACIGGSITEGTISSGASDAKVQEKKPYAEIFHSWWEEKFPQSEIAFVNAGIGGTDSYLGVHRLNREVLSYDPDLVLVEFSVNDGDNAFYKKSYDNLVRNLLQSEGHPAVMLLYMAQTNGTSAQNSHLLVGFHYKVPMVSYGNAIKTMMESGHYTEKELSGDGVHPSALGHAAAGEILSSYLEKVYAERESYEETEIFAEDPVTTAAYEHAELLDGTNLQPRELGTFAESDNGCRQYPDGWRTEEGDGGIVFQTEFQRLGLLYLRTTDGESGQFDIYVDGEAVRSVDADFSGGWGNAITAEEVYVGEEEAVHTVEIRKKEGSSGEKFCLLGLLTA